LPVERKRQNQQFLNLMASRWNGVYPVYMALTGNDYHALTRVGFQVFDNSLGHGFIPQGLRLQKTAEISILPLARMHHKGCLYSLPVAHHKGCLYSLPVAGLIKLSVCRQEACLLIVQAVRAPGLEDPVDNIFFQIQGNDRQVIMFGKIYDIPVQSIIKTPGLEIMRLLEKGFFIKLTGQVSVDN
jgi:hypothetical protein